MTRTTVFALVVGALACVAAAGGLIGQAQQNTPHVGYQDTPMLPGGKWHVHDGNRPQPKVIDPGTASTQETAGKPPSDAVVLFDGTDLSKWQGDKGAATWKVENGYMEVKPGSGAISTKDSFGDCQLHVEFSEPTPPRGSDQGRGNSGVFLFGVYEIQVLDSFDNVTYPDGQCASLYGQYPPLVNASRKPGEWQTYDIVFNAPKFKDGKLDTQGYLTMFHNGVLVHNHTLVLGETGHRVLPLVRPHGDKGPIGLQDHGMPVRFRNIWIRELKGDDQQ